MHSLTEHHQGRRRSWAAALTSLAAVNPEQSKTARPHIPEPGQQRGLFPQHRSPWRAGNNVTAYVMLSKRPFQPGASAGRPGSHIPHLLGRLAGRAGCRPLQKASSRKPEGKGLLGPRRGLGGRAAVKDYFRVRSPTDSGQRCSPLPDTRLPQPVCCGLSADRTVTVAPGNPVPPSGHSTKTVQTGLPQRAWRQLGAPRKGLALRGCPHPVPLSPPLQPHAPTSCPLSPSLS